MGFNLSGLVINKNYKNKLEELQEELGWKLTRKEEINFEQASSNWKENGICDIYFSEQGTLLFISIDKCAQSWGINNANTLTFALSETSMVFNINYCENGIEKRSIIEIEGNRIEDEGEKLKVEEISEAASEIIWNQIEALLGQPFWDIDLEEKAERFMFD